MGKRSDNLGGSEHIVLAAAARLQDSGGGFSRACGTAVVEEIERRTGRHMSMGAVCTTLERLEKRGLLESEISDREGRRAKRFYIVTDSGQDMLVETKQALEAIWKGLKLQVRPSLKINATSRDRLSQGKQRGAHPPHK